jgi:non-heme chloroperoxidase
LQPVILNWWRQGMMGGTKAHYDGIVAFSQTDFTEDLKKITVPVLVMHKNNQRKSNNAARWLSGKCRTEAGHAE